DEAGILVWQDFMFACGMYPADREFLQNVKEEVKDNVIRLRNHPCIALWCGNNEVLEGFTNWGWQEEIGKPFIKMAYEEYKKLFHETIPSILKELDPERPYWPSSPSSFMHGPPELTSGDFHYWDIIKEEIPLSSYASHVGRFMSEYGFKSYPAMETIQQYALPEDFDTRSDVMEAHQGWPGGRELVERHLLEGFRQPKDFESFVYLSQLMQSLALQTAIEAHRKAKPYCMGSLYWQLDDCWPCASWSGIDYYGNYKAFQYHLKHYFAPVLIIPSADKKKIEIAIVSDLPYAVSATLLVQLIDFDGIIKKSYHTQLRLGSGVSRNCFQQPILEWTRDIDLRYTVLHIALTEKLRLLAEKLYFFVPLRQLELPDPKIRTEFETVTDGTRIIINTSSFAKNVYIISSLATTRFSDNFFDMLPGEEKEVIAYHSPVSKAPESIFRLVTVRDTYCG
ncbi:MAG TPA: glycoside hydrolase family 2 protein, partial [Bacteroidales bacterium]|nr:glycoside hydrolase family 2 protein [Bacteroidales bacterium]